MHKLDRRTTRQACQDDGVGRRTSIGRTNYGVHVLRVGVLKLACDSELISVKLHRHIATGFKRSPRLYDHNFLLMVILKHFSLIASNFS